MTSLVQSLEHIRPTMASPEVQMQPETERVDTRALDVGIAATTRAGAVLVVGDEPAPE